TRRAGNRNRKHNLGGITAAMQDLHFNLEFIQPFSTFTADGKPQRIPYVIDGLLTAGGFSVIGAKPKQGKSSLARYEAVCIAKGLPFLGRDTERGEVILISLEDGRREVDNQPSALGYDQSKDEPSHIIERVSPDIDVTIAALEAKLTAMHDVLLIVVDTLMKLIRVEDVNNYMHVLTGVEKLRNL